MTYVKTIALGVVGVIVGAMLFALVAYFTGYMVGLVAIVSGAIAGLFCGMKSKDINTRHIQIMGALFGFVAIIMGYIITYLIPQEITPGVFVAAAEVMGFFDFLVLGFGKADILFMLAGIGAGYAAANWMHTRAK